MSDWKATTVKEISRRIISGGTPSTKRAEFYGGNIPWLNTKEINFRPIKSTEICISEEGLKNSSAKWIEANSIVVAMYGATAGKSAITKIPLTTNQASCNITVDESKADYRFIYYSLVNSYSELENMATGAAQQNLNVGMISNFNLLLPSFKEQKAIASVLSSFDEKIDLLHRQNKTLEAMAESLFRQWFVIEALGDWKDTRLEAHAEASRGLSYKGSGLADFGIGLPMHNLNSIFEGGGYKEAGIKFYSGEYRDRHLVKPGDIIVANTEQGHEFRLIGFPAIVPSRFGDVGIFSQHIYRLLARPSSYVTNEFLYYLLMTSVVREQVTSATNGSTVNMLAIDGLQRPVFKLPPKEKVLEFTSQVKLLWKKKDRNQIQILTLEKLRDTLLPKLVSGEVRVAYEH